MDVAVTESPVCPRSSPAPAPGKKRPAVRPWESAVVAAILLALLGLLTYQAWRVGVTVDEPSHLVSAYLYWQGADRLQPRDMPPLMKIVGGWIPKQMGLPLPADLGRAGDPRHEWDVALIMMTKMTREQIHDVFFRARMTMLAFPLLTAALIWWWGRQLFGPLAGVLLMVAFALEPTALGHGALFKNDLAATFGYLLFWFGAWRFWRNPRPGPAALLGAAVLLAVLSKMSMLFLFLVAPAIVLLRHLSRREIGDRGLAVALVLVALVPYVGTLAAYQFDYTRLSKDELSSLDRATDFPAYLRPACQIFRVIPVSRGMWQGAVSLVNFDGNKVGVYLLGQMHAGASPLYFPAALAVKAPVPLQILLVLGIMLVLGSMVRRKLEVSDAFWLLPGLLYIFMASFYPFQYGIRLILPALPFGLFLCGVAIKRLSGGGTRIVAVLLFAWLAVTSLRVYPYGIAFFNVWTGGPRNGIHYLTDSNVDWGQGLPELSAYIHESGIPSINVAYFGSNHLWSYVTDGVVHPLITPFSPAYIKSNPMVPAPGYYAISASYLTGHLFPQGYRDYFQAFRTRKPIAEIAYSIYVYKIDP